MLKVCNKLNRNQLKALEEYRTIKQTRRYVRFFSLFSNNERNTYLTLSANYERTYLPTLCFKIKRVRAI